MPKKGFEFLKIVIAVLLILLVMTGCSKNSEEVVSTPTVKSSYLESSCPRGISNDPYPGMCMLYTDQNNDKKCDLGN